MPFPLLVKGAWVLKKAYGLAKGVATVTAVGSVGLVVGGAGVAVVSPRFRTAVSDRLDEIVSRGFGWILMEVTARVGEATGELDDVVPEDWQGGFAETVSEWVGFGSWLFELKFALGLLLAFFLIQAVIGVIGVVKKCIPFISG
jgi:predicted sugar kinase